jgi:DNA repair photolyase
MVAVIKAKRKSPVLAPSSLACLSAIPTINLTAGCLHDCAYCYIRGYSTFPGEGKLILYENTLEKLRNELVRRHTKPPAVYFSPSSDLFQPAPEVLELSEAILKFLFREGIGVAILTKGRIPRHMLQLLIDHSELVRAQIGLVSLDEGISRAFEVNAAPPRRRLEQMEALIAGGVATEARLDPILPTLTDAPESADRLFAALAEVGVRRASAGVLFLRPAIVRSLKRNVPDKAMLARLLAAYQQRERIGICANGSSVQTLPLEARHGIFARMREAAAPHNIELSICACKNPDLAGGSCNIGGTWSWQLPRAVQLALIR